MSNLANLRELLRDERVPTVAARVALHDGESEHYRVNDEGDIIVSVLTLQHEVPIWANLDALAGSAGYGVWCIPEVDTEVNVAFDNGDFEGEAYITMRTSGGNAPEGLVPGKVLVLGLTVEIRSPDGTATKLPTLADYNALRASFNSHTHLVSGVSTGPANITSGTILPAAVVLPPSGTVILKAQ